MLKLHLDEEKLYATGEVFPAEITNDPWIVYHGTSSSSAAAIEKSGLQWNPSFSLTRVDLDTIIGAFQKMWWTGSHSGGYPVLRGFTFGDFATKATKPVFFAEQAFRSTLYAMHDWAGGESWRAARHAISDLAEYINSPKLQDEHRREIGCLKPGMSVAGVLLDAVPKMLSIEEVRTLVDGLDEIRQRGIEIKENHTHGLVYAVKFCEDDLENLVYDSARGIELHGSVGPDRIVAECMVPNTFKLDHFRQPDEVSDHSFRLYEDATSLVSRLRAAANALR